MCASTIAPVCNPGNALLLVACAKGDPLATRITLPKLARDARHHDAKHQTARNLRKTIK